MQFGFVKFLLSQRDQISKAFPYAVTCAETVHTCTVSFILSISVKNVCRQYIEKFCCFAKIVYKIMQYLRILAFSQFFSSPFLSIFSPFFAKIIHHCRYNPSALPPWLFHIPTPISFLVSYTVYHLCIYTPHRLV